MPTYTQIGSAVSVGVLGAATIDFTAIPSTYTDLVLKMSLRTNRVAADIDEALMTFNGATSNFSFRYIWGFGSGTPSSDNPGGCGPNPMLTWTGISIVHPGSGAPCGAPAGTINVTVMA